MVSFLLRIYEKVEDKSIKVHIARVRNVKYYKLYTQTNSFFKLNSFHSDKSINNSKRKTKIIYIQIK